jgi:hypothetical protein
MKSIFKKLFPFAAFTLSFVFAVAYVFWGTWSPEVAFVQPDQGIVYPADFISRMFTRIFAGSPFVPGDLRFLLGGPYVWQELQYALAMYLAALGVVYYLKGRKLPPLACYGAGAAYGLMGYNFTLFSAGHLGWFIYLMYGPFVFGLIDRCVRKGKWLNWILLGGVLAWSAAQQPDMWLMFTCFAFIYGVYRTAFAVYRSSARMRRFGGILAGALVSAAVMTAAGWPQLYNAVAVQTVNRDKQIADSISSAMDGGKNASLEGDAEKRRRYVFCTNWSLPPDETLEFMVADINGASSDPRVSPKNRYCGRIGMQIAPGRWSPYRQHSLYMGLFTVCFALAGVCVLLPFVRRKSGFDFSGGNRIEVMFWLATAMLFTLCAFGCFTPFYKLVFAMPMGDYVRCPVKFVHLVEWCIAVLAGFGIAFLLSSDFARRFSKIVVPAVFALLLVNIVNLASVAARYCAVDPGDTARIAAARETGCEDVGFVMDGNAPVSSDAVIAGGTAFRDNAALKAALAEKSYSIVSFRNFTGGRFVKTARERAGFAVLKAAKPKSRDENAGKPISAVSILSCMVTFAVMAVVVCKALRGCRLRWKPVC